jgi:L-aspartate oxidase
MRGEGGILKNKFGERFMPRYDERAELAPRDIVSRSIVAEMRRTGTRNVFLDMTAMSEDFLKHRFPMIFLTCERFGLNIATDPLPVSPASHYFMGGVRTDLWGRSSLPGLYAAGEVTCTGVHGANRLASNSLLEGLVFGARAGESAAKDNVSTAKSRTASTSATVNDERAGPLEVGISTAVRKRVKRIMWERVGILREHDALRRALQELETISAGNLSTSSRNFVTLAQIVARGAIWREESRGGHFRTDFPTEKKEFKVHSIQKIGSGISMTAELDFSTSDRATEHASAESH